VLYGLVWKTMRKLIKKFTMNAIAIPMSFGCKWWQPHREHSHKRDTDIHREADECGSHELQKATESCLTIEHKPADQIIVDKSCDVEAQLAFQKPRRRSPHNPHSRRLRNPDQLRRRERCRPNSWLKGGLLGSDAILVQPFRPARQSAELKQIDLRPPIHLSLDQF
jgi:hypothetical protein